MPDARTARVPEAWARRIREVEEQAAQACQRALERTPPEYREYVVLIEQRKKVGEDPADLDRAGRPRAYWATVRQPYMTVDGRIAMAVDEHRAQGKTIEIGRPEWGVEPQTGQLLCYVTVDCPLRGRATGVARVVTAPSGVNATNPLENAQTSAVGRALGFLGYGVFGGGIASADEVLAALAQRADTAGRPANGDEPAPETPAPRPGAAAEPSEPAAETVQARVEALAAELGLRPGELDLLRAQAPTPEALAARLEALRAARQPQTAPGQTDPAARVDRGEFGPEDFVGLAEHLGATAEGYRAWLKRTYGQDDPRQLSPAQVERERQFFQARFRSATAREAFLAKCQPPAAA